MTVSQKLRTLVGVALELELSEAITMPAIADRYREWHQAFLKLSVVQRKALLVQDARLSGLREKGKNLKRMPSCVRETAGDALKVCKHAVAPFRMFNHLVYRLLRWLLITASGKQHAG
jgi:hypothetical protein